MFKRKDVIRSMFLLMLIVSIMITLSQILVVHHHSHKEHKPKDYSKFRNMLRELERCINMMLKHDVLPFDKYLNAFTAVVYSKRIAKLVKNLQSNTGSEKVSRKRDGIYKPVADRHSRFLQHIDVGKQHSDEDRAYLNGAIVNDNAVELEKQGHVKDDSFERHDLDTRERMEQFEDEDDSKSRRMKGYSWQRYKRVVPQSQNRTRHKCPMIPEGLEGPLNVDPNVRENVMIHAGHRDVEPGGMWEPSTCVPRHHVAIIIPYRERWNHLRILLHFLIPVLQRQLIKFRIFVVEQNGSETFNKGRLMNAAFKEAWKLEDFDCFIFHDVDLIPEDDRNMYTCPSQPRHMSVAVDKFKYVLPYYSLVGGVFSIRGEHFQKVNGYSNLYWGWGAEDDDMYRRLKQVGLNLIRPSTLLGRYKMIPHDQREVIPLKWRRYLLETVIKRFRKDGLNSLDYNVTFINNNPLFTHIMVDIGPPPSVMPNISNLMH